MIRATALRAPSSVAVLKRVCDETPRPLREIDAELPQWLEALVARLHAKAPTDRFTSAREVADLLARHLAEVQRGGATAAPAQPRRRGVRMAAAVVLALLAGLGLSEAIGLSNVRGRVVRAMARPTAPAPVAALPVDAAAWERHLAELPPDQQIKEVAARLADLNPRFNGTITPTITINNVLSTDHVTDLAPVRALVKLSSLDVSGTEGTVRVPSNGHFLEVAGTQGKLIDLAPLKGMSLSVLNCNRTKVADLSPLEGMPLIVLDLSGTSVSNVSLLRGMPLTELNLNSTRVSDVSPLTKPPLMLLNLGRTAVSDLSPLEGMEGLHTLVLDGTPITDVSSLKNLRLKSLRIRNTQVSDLTPLKGMPLKEIWLDDRPAPHAEVLRALTGLERINGKPAADFWLSREQ